MENKTANVEDERIALDAGETTVRCPDCNLQWCLTSEHREWFISRGMRPARRCPDCRARRREWRERDARNTN